MTQEQISIDGIDVNDLAPWFVREFKFTPAKKKQNWAESPMSDGAALAGDESHYSNAEMEFTVMAMPQTDMGTALGVLHQLTNKLQAARQIRGGLPLTWVVADSGVARTLYILDAEYDDLLATRDEGWFDKAPSVRVHLYLRPFLYGPEQRVLLGISDPLQSDSLTNGQWRFDAGDTTNTSISGGRMVFSTTALKRLYRPSASTNQTVYMRFRFGAALTGSVRVLIKRTTSADYLTANFNPVTGFMTIRRFVAGVPFDLAGTSTPFVPAPSAFCWLVGSIDGNEVSASIYTAGQNPVQNPGAVPNDTISWTLVAPDDAQFGDGVYGNPGISINPDPTSWQVDNFVVRNAPEVRNSEPIFGFELHDIPGEVPAEGRLVVTESASPAQSRSHLEWGMESRTYDTNGAWPYLIDSDALVGAPGFAGVQIGPAFVLAGAYDPHGGGANVIAAFNISETVPLSICSTGDQFHVGTFKIKARVHGSEGLKARLAWRVGDGQHIRNNFSRTLLGLNWEEIDLGTIIIPEAAIGEQTWEGRVECYGASGGTLLLDYLELIPVERYGVARAPLQPIQPTVYTAYDSFNQSATGVNGAALPQAPADGQWHTSGAGTDFAVNLTFHDLRRSKVSDPAQTAPPATIASTAINSGRYAVVGTTNFTTIQVQCDIRGDPGGGAAGAVPPNDTLRMGVFARYLNQYEWFMVARQNFIGDGGVPRTRIRVLKRSMSRGTPAGTPVQLATKVEGEWGSTGISSNRTIILVVDSLGVWQVYSFEAGTTQPVEPFLSGQDSDLATSGPLQTGKFGVYDAYTYSAVRERVYDNFVAFAPTQDVVLHPARRLEVRADRTEREAVATVPPRERWGRPPMYRGSRFFVPPAGDSERISRVALKARRNDVDGGLPDPNISDALTASVYVTPRYLLPSP